MLELSKTTAGRHQALQVSNQVAIEQVKSLNQLKQLLMTQIQMHGNYMAYMSEKEAVAAAYEQKMTERDAGDIIVTGNEAYF